MSHPYSDQEKISILGTRTELAYRAAKRWREFCDSASETDSCECFGCFTTWLQKKEYNLLQGLASNWMHFFSFIENKGALKPEWDMSNLNDVLSHNRKGEIVRDNAEIEEILKTGFKP